MSDSTHTLRLSSILGALSGYNDKKKAEDMQRAYAQEMGNIDFTTPEGLKQFVGTTAKYNPSQAPQAVKTLQDFLVKQNEQDTVNRNKQVMTNPVAVGPLRNGYSTAADPQAVYNADQQYKRLLNAGLYDEADKFQKLEQMRSYAPKPEKIEYEIKQDQNGNYVRIPKQPGYQVSQTGIQGKPDKPLVDFSGANFAEQKTPQVSTKTRNDIEASLNKALEFRSYMTSAADAFRPEMLTAGAKLGMGWDSLRSRFDANALTPEEQNNLDSYISVRSDVGRLTAEKIKEMSGGAVTPEEAKRQFAYLPNVGDDPFNPFSGDPPPVFAKKMEKFTQSLNNAVARQAYILRRGNMSIEDIPLDAMPNIIRSRGNELASRFKTNNAGANESQIKEYVRQQLAYEFGLLQ